ncbi:MAG: carbon monoxide dehydrogenase protein, partial [bacterium]|nr:carbon monoxide dehydrogenase protein [bacterium]
MLDKLLEFGELCRRNGLRVSTAEMLDTVAAAELVGFDDPELLRGALEATLVKRRADADIFDELFALYFRQRGDWDRGSDEAPPLVEALRKEGLTDEEIEHLIAMLADEAARMSPLARMGLGLRRTHVEALIRLAGVRLDFSRLTNPMQIGFFTQQLYEALNPSGARGELDGMFGRLGGKIGQERAELMARIAAEQMNRARSSLRRYVADEFERRNLDFVDQMRQQILANKPFGAMSEEELGKLRGEVTRLAKKLKQLASLRPRVGRRGRLDARKTLRKALASGGVPFKLVHKRRRIEKPRLVVLCDISDSVRNVSRFMLQFAYTLQELFSKVRSFVFVSDLGECTELFKQHEIQRAVDLAYS